MESKACSRCGEIKPLEKYNKDSKAKDGKRSDCKVCENSRKKSYYAANKEKLRASSAAYRAKNKEKLREVNAKHYASNPEKMRANSVVSNAVRDGNIPQIPAGMHRHHWSYRERHQLDVIILSIKAHGRLHAATTYDPDLLVYRRNDTGEALDTREKVEQFIATIKGDDHDQ